MVALMVNNPLLPVLDLSCLRLVSCGGSPQSPAIVAKAVAAFACEFFISYGMTECCGKITMSILPPVSEWRQQGLPPQQLMELVCSSGRPFIMMQVNAGELTVPQCAGKHKRPQDSKCLLAVNMRGLVSELCLCLLLLCFLLL